MHTDHLLWFDVRNQFVSNQDVKYVSDWVHYLGTMSKCEEQAAKTPDH